MTGHSHIQDATENSTHSRDSYCTRAMASRGALGAHASEDPSRKATCKPHASAVASVCSSTASHAGGHILPSGWTALVSPFSLRTRTPVRSRLFSTSC
ncbi:hypothetical protein ACCO45_010768 [Purpureocillium lilacinum]|uniref:Uncharacterized protein n=1 Tax=Purpureocillium lilacinum TaxID=33203 RepID=A0ACC4DIR7_PURLI